MKNVNIRKLLLALLVVFFFMLVGVAIGDRNYWLASLYFLLGFLVMGYGMSMKRKERKNSNG